VDYISLKVIESRTIWKLEYGFLFALHSNYGRICSHYGDIQRQRMAWPWNLGLGSVKVIENILSIEWFYFQWRCNFAWSWMIWGKFSTTRTERARSLCDSWVSCFCTCLYIYSIAVSYADERAMTAASLRGHHSRTEDLINPINILNMVRLIHSIVKPQMFHHLWKTSPIRKIYACGGGLLVVPINASHLFTVKHFHLPCDLNTKPAAFIVDV